MAVFLDREEAQIILHTAKYDGFWMGEAEFAEEINITDFSGMVKSMIVIRENPLAVAPAKIIKIVLHPLRENDGIGSLHEGFFFSFRGSTRYNDVDISIDARVKRKNHEPSILQTPQMLA